MVRFDASTHTYTNDNGKVLISVTQLLRKHSITPDFSHVNPELLAAKAERGTMIHKEIEDYIKNGDIGFTDECSYFISNIYPKFKKLYAEVILYTDQYAGTSDIIAVDLNGALWIIDTKTGQVHKEAVRWQDSLYKRALLEMIEKGLIDIKYDVNQPIHLAVFDAKGFDSSFYELPEITDDKIDELLRCEFEDDSIYGTDLINLDGNLVDRALVLEKAITDLESQKKAMDLEYKTIKEQIQLAMHNAGIKNFKTDKVSITLKESYERTTVDSKKLQEKFPEVFEACKKTSTVSESLMITVKDN